MENVSAETKQQDQDQQQPDGMKVPDGFADRLINDSGDVAEREQQREQREETVEALAEEIIEKASVMLHKGFHKSMKKRGRPGLRDVSPEDMGKIAAICVPERVKRQHPVVVYLSLWSGILADNFLINAPDQSEPETETEKESKE